MQFFDPISKMDIFLSRLLKVVKFAQQAFKLQILATCILIGRKIKAAKLKFLFWQFCKYI